MIRNYLKIALRNLLRNKVFSFINIVGLAAGLSCCMLICLYVFDELSYDTQHDNVDQLYQVGTTFIRSDGENNAPATPAQLAEAMQREYPEIENTTRLIGLFGDDKTLMRYEKTSKESLTYYESNGYLADPSFFSFFKYNFIEGNPFQALRKPNTIVLSEEIAQKIFGKTSALNKTLYIESNTNGASRYLVTGVFRPSITPSHIDGRFFLSFKGGGIDNYLKTQTGMASNNMFFTYLKLKPNANAQKLEAKFPAFVEKYMRNDLKATAFDKKQFLTPVKDIHLYSKIPDNVTPNGSLSYLYILISIAAFTLLIACINFMNLSTARSSKRSGEVGVRKVLGAEQNTLIRQFLAESLVFSTLSFVLSILFLVLLLPLFEQISGKNIDFSFSQNIKLFSIFFVLSLLTGLLAGSYPAFYLSSFKPIMVLKGKFTNSLAVISLRKGLVVFQFTLSAILIIATLIIYKQMWFLRSSDLGFAKDQQIVIPLRSESAKNSYIALKNALRNNPQVISVGASAYYPGIFNPEDANFFGEKQTQEDAKNTRTNRVDYDYLQTLGIKPVAGRLFAPEFVADTNLRVIINEQAVKAMGYRSAKEAIGKSANTLHSGTQYTFTIVGVVKDFHFEDLHTPIKPYAFTLNIHGNYNYMIAHIKANDVPATLHDLATSWHKFNPNESLEYNFLDENFQKNYKAENRLSSIVGYFTFIAILISCLGLFGLAMFTAEQRTKEIGIRKVLGASVSNITALLSKDFLKLVFIAIIIASPIAYYFMYKWLQDFAYRIDISWGIFILAGIISISIALLTVSYQAIRAALTNPVKSLRTE